MEKANNYINIIKDSPTEDLNWSSNNKLNAPIKRPNSTIGIPNSKIDPAYFNVNQTTRGKANSLTLEANSFINTQSNITSGSSRTSLRSPPNGNLLSTLSPIAPSKLPLIYSSKINLYENPLNTGSNMSSPNCKRPSYFDEEQLRLQQQILNGRKERLFSVGQTFHIQIKRPPTNLFDWKDKTWLEKTLLVTLVCLIISFSLFIVANKLSNGTVKETTNQICFSSECVKTAASLLNAMDLSADPCEDFFQFACGTWNKRHVIPEDKSSISTFEVLGDDVNIVLKDLLEKPANRYDNSATIKAKLLYKSCMQKSKIDEIGDKPLRNMIHSLGGWPILDKSWNSPRKLETLLGHLKGDFNQGIIIEQWVGPDDKNSSLNIIQLDQMGFGLPSREYYLKNNSVKERDAYSKMMINVAVLLGADQGYAKREMENVLQFESQLANVSMPEADRHDTGAIYTKLTVEELGKIVPEIDWLLYLNSFMPTKIDQNELIVVYSMDYFKNMGKILSKFDTKVIHNYALWRLIHHLLPYLDGDFGVAYAEYRKVLHGISADRVRWDFCVTFVNKKMGMAVGALFIKDNFDPRSKETALEMIRNIREAFNELLAINDWMDDETRKVAKQKADSINERIGYPDFLTNPIELSNEYQNLQINESQFLINIFQILKFDSTKNLVKLRLPVNKDRWTTDPAHVNAFYNPNKNDIVFPAGILQPLFYSQHFPKSLNYGGIGVVIGHEITHGFDDKGRQFDKNGNLKQWWNDATIQRFRKRAQCIIDQYSSYVLKDIGMNVNGKMTQGENIADNGGLKQAYRAFKKWESLNGVEPLLPGINMTHDQLFFLNYAQIWCGSNRPEDAISKIRSAVHSPGLIRVLGPLSNSYDFARVYNCPLKSRMNPEKKCNVW